MENYKSLSTTLLQLRKSKGITQVELGKEIGVTNKTISKWENGIFLPDITYLVTIADYYGLSVDELLRGTEYESKTMNQNEKVNKIVDKYAEKHQFKSGLLVIVLLECIFFIINVKRIIKDKILLISTLCLLIASIVTFIIYLIGYLRKK